MKCRSHVAVKTIGIIAIALSCSALRAAEADIPLSAAIGGGAPAGKAPWVNLLLRDFSDAGDMGSYEWIRNTVELQVTTGSEKYDPGPCCPVQGKGNLGANQRVKAVYLNIASRLDPSKLRVYWAGEAMTPGPEGSNVFAASGARPSRIQVNKGAFRSSGAGTYDAYIEWQGSATLGPETPYVKLLLVYDGAKTDISPDDFAVSNGTARAAATVDAGGADVWIRD